MYSGADSEGVHRICFGTEGFIFMSILLKFRNFMYFCSEFSDMIHLSEILHPAMLIMKMQNDDTKNESKELIQTELPYGA